jgi:hypothetical protein
MLNIINNFIMYNKMVRNCFCGNEDLSDKIHLITETFDGNNLDGCLYVKYCKKCNHNFNISVKSSNADYIDYYTNLSKYHHGSQTITDNGMYMKQVNYIQPYLETYAVNSILNYGSGNTCYKDLFRTSVCIDNYDVGDLDINNRKYDLLLISHVLEHVYDLNHFLDEIKINMNSNGIVYIEVPNSERYDLMQYDVPLQEINIEHINFFSKHSLAKLMILNNFTPICIEDCCFEIKHNTKYHVIRSIFRLNTENVGFDKYLIDGQSKLDKIKSFFLQKPQTKMYLYGAGAFTCKIIGEFKSNIIGIVDDNPSYLGKCIAGFEVINYDMFKTIVNENDTILVTIIFSSNKIKEKLMSLDKILNITCVDDITM